MNQSWQEDGFSRAVQGLDWLLRLRWIAAVTIVFFAALASVVYAIEIPWKLVIGVTAMVATTNAWLRWRKPQNAAAVQRWLVFLVFGDVILLTVLLYYTGGAHNPFTVLYVLHITLAVMLLNATCAWSMVALCGAGFGLLFFSDHMLIGPDGGSVCDDLDFHLQGMLAATMATGAGVVYFVAHLNRSLAHLREVAAHAREMAETERHFSSLLGMAAGVAHELATPLGTIAVASHELETSSQAAGCNSECRRDVRLIRTGVNKCAKILERMRGSFESVSEADASPMPLGDVRLLLHNYLSHEIAGNVEWRWDEHFTRQAVIPCNDSLLILGNIIRNAWEATEGLHPVIVEVSANDACAIFHISDQGPGMPQEILQRLGEPFFSTKKNHENGMGLGFFLAKSMAEKRGGSIRVRSTPGSGTTITAEIPFCKRESSAHMPHEHSARR